MNDKLFLIGGLIAGGVAYHHYSKKKTSGLSDGDNKIVFDEKKANKMKKMMENQVYTKEAKKLAWEVAHPNGNAEKRKLGVWLRNNNLKLSNITNYLNIIDEKTGSKEERNLLFKKKYWDMYDKIKLFPISTYKFLKNEKEIIENLISDLKSGSPLIYNDNQLIKAYFIIAKKYAENYLKNKGWKIHYKSKSSIYLIKNEDVIRISDHWLPDTEQRRYNSKIGYSNGANLELIIEEIYSPKELDKLLNEKLKWI